MEYEKKDALATFRLSTDLPNWFKDYAKRQRTTVTHIFTEILLEMQQKDMETEKI